MALIQPDLMQSGAIRIAYQAIRIALYLFALPELVQSGVIRINLPMMHIEYCHDLVPQLGENGIINSSPHIFFYRISLAEP